MDKPTLYRYNSKENHSVYLSILKQCLKFGKKKDTNATLAIINIYKIAYNLDLYLNNFIDCQEDLQLILKKVPSYMYAPLLNKLE